MKSKILSLFAIIAMTIGLSACHSDEPTIGPDIHESGQVSLRSLGVDVNNAEVVINGSSDKNISSRASVDLSDFQVSIFKGAVLVKKWRYADMPELFTLEPGDYTVKIISHDVQKAEWEHPLFVGEKNFTIENDQITEIGVVTCSLANIKVSIVYDKSLLDLLTKDDAKVTVIANDEGRLEYKPEETRAGYFEALEGSSTLVAEFTGTIKRNFETMRVVYNDVKPGQHRIITFKVNDPNQRPDETGGIAIGDGLYLDVEVTDVNLTYSLNVEETNIPDNRPSFGEPDTPDPGPGPDDPDDDPIKITSETLSFTENNPIDVSPAEVFIHSDKGIAHFLVKIESSNQDFLASAGELLPLSFDLAYPGEYEDIFRDSLKFPVGNEVIGANDLTFNISELVPLLQAFPGTHKFTLSVEDVDAFQKIVSITFVAN